MKDTNKEAAHSMTGKPLSIRGTSKIYENRSSDKIIPLPPVNLEIGAGELVAISDPSGCSKSSLLYMMAGFRQSSTDTILASADRITKPNMERGMVFQSCALFPWIAVIGNVEFGFERRGLSKANRRAAALRYLQMEGMQYFFDKQIDELSGGMKQRAAIAGAFATEPAIIVMDEPIGG